MLREFIRLRLILGKGFIAQREQGAQLPAKLPLGDIGAARAAEVQPVYAAAGIIAIVAVGAVGMVTRNGGGFQEQVAGDAQAAPVLSGVAGDRGSH